MKKTMFLIPLLLHLIASCSVYQSSTISSDDKAQLDTSKSLMTSSTDSSYTYYHENIKDYSQINFSKCHISTNVDEEGNEYTYNFPSCPTSAIIHTKNGLNKFIDKYPELYNKEQEYFDSFEFERNSIFLCQYKTDYYYQKFYVECITKVKNTLFTELKIDYKTKSNIQIVFNIFTTIKKCSLTYSQIIVSNKEICDIKRLTIYGD